MPVGPVGMASVGTLLTAVMQQGCYDAAMRTTLEIDDDVVMAARQLARIRNEKLGQTISDLARRGLLPESIPVIEMRDGIPVFMHPPGAVTVTSEMVRNLADEE